MKENGQSQDGEQRVRIMETALTLINEGLGARAITMRKIAAKANVALGLINYYFPSKNDLLLATCNLFADNHLIKPLFELQDNGEKNQDDIFLHLVECIGKFCADNEYVARMLFLHELADPSENDVTEACISKIAGLLENGDKLDKTKAQAEAGLLFGSILQFFLRANEWKRLTGKDFFVEHERKDLLSNLCATRKRDL